jgi:hypothetical protein
MSDSSVVKIEPKRRRGRKARANAEKLIAVNLRLPEPLYQRIETAAHAAFRSVAQEIHMRLATADPLDARRKPDPLHAER